MEFVHRPVAIMGNAIILLARMRLPLYTTLAHKNKTMSVFDPKQTLALGDKIRKVHKQ